MDKVFHGLFLLVLMHAGLARAQGARNTASLFSTQIETYPCNRQVKARLGSKVIRRTWIPVTVFERSGILPGLSHRNSVEQKAYLLFRDHLTVELKEFDLNTKTQRQIVWNSKEQCQPKISDLPTTAPTASPSSGFTDANLSALLTRNKWGVIYVWSPYMPLSIKAATEIKSALAKTDGSLTILVDGKASPTQVAAWVKRGLIVASDKVSVGETTPALSTELDTRGLGLHYPALFVYKSGYLSNRTYLGHKRSDSYKKWIDLELKTIDQELL